MKKTKSVMPKIYYVADLSMGRYHVGRTDWQHDSFELVDMHEFMIFLKIMNQLSYPIIDGDVEEV